MKAEDSQQTISRELHSKKVDRGPYSQRIISRELEPKKRQVRVVYRCWNFAVKVSFGLTFADPQRAFHAAILTRLVVAAAGDRT